MCKTTDVIFDLYPDLSSKLIEEGFLKDNYLIEQGKGKNNYAVIYFSGNGIYYPNINETFTEEIFQKNRFEYYKKRIVKANKHIYVRDILKQFYIGGINSKTNNPNKLLDFLKQETKGKKIITVGSSAGGYAAVLYGILLNAEYIFSFSGLFNLIKNFSGKESYKDYKLLYQYCKFEPYEKYYNLDKLVKNTNIPIFYLFPAENNKDIIQYELVKNFKNIYPFKIKSSQHSTTLTSNKALNEYLNSSPLSLRLISRLLSDKAIKIEDLTKIFEMKYRINRVLCRSTHL